MEQTFLVKVTVSGLSEKINYPKRKLIADMLNFWVTGVGDGFYDGLYEIVSQLVDDINIKLEIVDEDAN